MVIFVEDWVFVLLFPVTMGVKISLPECFVFLVDRGFTAVKGRHNFVMMTSSESFLFVV